MTGIQALLKCLEDKRKRKGDNRDKTDGWTIDMAMAANSQHTVCSTFESPHPWALKPKWGTRPKPTY